MRLAASTCIPLLQAKAYIHVHLALVIILALDRLPACSLANCIFKPLGSARRAGRRVRALPQLPRRVCYVFHELTTSLHDIEYPGAFAIRKVRSLRQGLLFILLQDAVLARPRSRVVAASKCEMETGRARAD